MCEGCVGDVRGCVGMCGDVRDVWGCEGCVGMCGDVWGDKTSLT